MSYKKNALTKLTEKAAKAGMRYGQKTTTAGKKTFAYKKRKRR